MPVYKDKKTGTWYFWCRYTDYKGDQRQKMQRGFKLKREAEQAERKFLETRAHQPDMPFHAFYEIYKADQFPRLRESTRQTRGYHMKNRIMPFFKDFPLNEIDAVLIRKWQNKLIGADLKHSYIRTLQRDLSAVLNHAVNFYGLSKNPCKLAKVPKPVNEQKKPMRFWTFEEYNKVINNITDIKAKTAVMLLYWSGMRKGELLALKWRKIDFDAKQVIIDQSLQRLKGQSVITPTKTSVARTISIPRFVIEQLKDYRQVLYKPTPDNFVFEWEKRFIELGISEGCKASGVKRIHVHGLRHSHASFLISQGVNIVLISKRLGHANVSMTLDTYSHFFPDDEAKMIENIEALVSASDQDKT